MSHHHARGWEHEIEIMRELDGEFGHRLQAIADMRDRAISEIDQAGLQPRDLVGHPSILLLLLLSGITGLDAIRVLLEHGYPGQAYALTRSLYETEVDAYLLADDPDLAYYYSDFEVWDYVNHAAKAVQEGIVTDDPDHQAALERRRDELTEAYDRADLELPEGYRHMSLDEAAEDFARKRWDRPFPVTWRPPFRRRWPDILDRIIPLQFQTLIPDETTNDEAYTAFLNNRRMEHTFSYREMSSRLHISPRIAAERWLEFRVGDNLDEMDRVVTFAGSHFLRLHHIVAAELGIEYDPAWWVDALQRANGEAAAEE